MKRLALMLVLSLCSLSAVAAGAARERLDTFAKGLHSLSGRFSQTMSSANGDPGKTSSGTMALEAPRQFRWETTAPYKQTIVADGSRVWLFDPDLEQVTVRKQSTEESQSPLTVLTDISQLDRDFKVTEQGERDGLTWLRLTSTGKDPQFAFADLGFDANGLARMMFRDQLGNTTEIRFAGWVRNAALPAGTFSFTPPEGADVIGDAPVLMTQPIKN
ncbi:outer membrane lipoprotein carrier protein [Luteibacter rhizovicinus]|uniref:Outer-membrane lipoprotein carrier protein n=1 Tax=Luteibacter rhizovicinus TaxID=242606 RepID=A0A4V2W3S8_9GAMM|nr:outer membrane lipoprotein chaperone LolA [Luteibacter rhizovicinus]TCV93149.1 outer membrane lipoprotein carrier protein [Luteibacter rhizovicinus]